MRTGCWTTQLDRMSKQYGPSGTRSGSGWPGSSPVWATEAKPLASVASATLRPPRQQERVVSNEPAVSPAYPEPPWAYTNASIINVVVKVGKPERLRDFVADGLEPRGDSDTVVFFFLDVPGIPEFG